MTRDQTPGTNLRISHIHVLLNSLGQHVPLKINVGFAKVWRKIFLAKMAFSTGKNLEQPSPHTYIYIYIYFVYLLIIHIVHCVAASCVFLWGPWARIDCTKEVRSVHKYCRRKRMNYSKANETTKGTDGSTDWNPLDTTLQGKR